eukprot:gene5313-6618_t
MSYSNNNNENSIEKSKRRISVLSDQLVLSTNLTSSSTTTPSQQQQQNKYEFILVSIDSKSKVATVTINRPKSFNAFNHQSASELLSALQSLDLNDNVHSIVLTGGPKVFACGADIKEMVNLSMQDMIKRGQLIDKLCEICTIEKPIIGAVSGFALGGGCEVALMCDVVIASETAKFGQPEIKIGTIPGAGGTQRLARAVGKSKAMEMILTGRMLDAKEALAYGFVSKVVPTDKLLEEATKLAVEVASFSLPVIKFAKETVNKSFDTGLTEGLYMEKRVFHSTFALNDRKEGMDAFSNKRTPKWSNS